MKKAELIPFAPEKAGVGFGFKLGYQSQGVEEPENLPRP